MSARKITPILLLLLAGLARADESPKKSNQEYLAECAARFSVGREAQVYRLDPEQRPLYPFYGRKVRKIVLANAIPGNGRTTYAVIPISPKRITKQPHTVKADRITFLTMNGQEYRRFTDAAKRIGVVTVETQTETGPGDHPVTVETTQLGSILEINEKYYVVIAKSFVERPGSTDTVYAPEFTLAEYSAPPKKGDHQRATKYLTFEPGGEIKLNDKVVGDMRAIGEGIVNTSTLIMNGRAVHSAIFLEWTSAMPPGETLVYSMKLRDFREN